IIVIALLIVDSVGPARGVVGRGRRWTASTYFFVLVNRYVRIRYVCNLARVWRPPTSYGVHTLLFRTTPLGSNTNVSFSLEGPAQDTCLFTSAIQAVKKN